jgi:hypothetical protein
MHNYNVELLGSTNVGKTTLFRSLGLDPGKSLIGKIAVKLPLGDYFLGIELQIWDVEFKGFIPPRRDVGVIIYDPSRMDTLQTAIDKLIPTCFLRGYTCIVLLQNNIENRIHKIEFESVRQEVARLYPQVLVLETACNCPPLAISIMEQVGRFIHNNTNHY